MAYFSLSCLKELQRTAFNGPGASQIPNINIVSHSSNTNQNFMIGPLQLLNLKPSPRSIQCTIPLPFSPPSPCQPSSSPSIHPPSRSPHIPSTKNFQPPPPCSQHSHPQHSYSLLACRSANPISPALIPPIPPISISHPHLSLFANQGTHIPLSKPQLHPASTLSSQALIILQASADDACGD